MRTILAKLENSEPFAAMSMLIFSAARQIATDMEGGDNELANAMLHALALCFYNAEPSQRAEQAKAFAEQLPALAERYAAVLSGVPVGNG